MRKSRSRIWSRVRGVGALIALGGAPLAGCGPNAGKNGNAPDTATQTTPTATKSPTAKSATAKSATGKSATGKSATGKNATAGAAKTPAKSSPAKTLPAGWQKFTAKSGGYTIWMPGKTTIKTNAVPTELGEIKAHITSATQGESAFLVIYADYPESVLKADPQSILAGARSGAVKRMNGQLQSEKKITLNGFAGREFAATAVVGKEKKKMFVRARLYLARRRLYQLIVVGPEKTKPTGAIETFFSSFKISK